MRLEQLFENENKLITPTKFKNYYLEVCPEEYEFKSKWGPKSVTNATSYIDGYKNTVQMHLHGNEAAKRVLDLVIDGKDDWYVPANDELNHIYDSRIDYSDDWYWSSTEFSVANSWGQYFGNGTTANFTKLDIARVRAVRRVYKG